MRELLVLLEANGKQFLEPIKTKRQIQRDLRLVVARMPRVRDQRDNAGQPLSGRIDIFDRVGILDLEKNEAGIAQMVIAACYDSLDVPAVHRSRDAYYAPNYAHSYYDSVGPRATGALGRVDA